MIQVPVLFLVFNRMETTQKVFEAIRQAQPKKLYIACDGPRETRAGEAEKVEAVRSFVTGQVDWPCEVKTLFREKNLGCGKAVSSAINWFFENEEMGIILEDDCYPSQTFFPFCEEMLFKYKDDNRVMQVNGSSFIQGLPETPSYSFSKYSFIWGWATWRRAWHTYQFTRSNFEAEFETLDIFASSQEKREWFNIFKHYFDGKIDTWDYPWTFSIWMNRGLSITPHKNFVKNIGFGPGATHTTDIDAKLANLVIYDMDKFIHPSDVKQDVELDRKTFKEVFASPTLVQRILKRLKKML